MKNMKFGKCTYMNIPEKIKDDLNRASDEQRSLFENAYNHLKATNLELYYTNQPDIRARHPETNIDFISLQFGIKKGVHIEIRVDSLPIDILSTTPGTEMFSITLKHWESGENLYGLFSGRNARTILSR
jgi:hypothetical protein